MRLDQVESTLVVRSEGHPHSVKVVSQNPLRLDGVERWAIHALAHGEHKPDDLQLIARLDGANLERQFSPVGTCIYCGANAYSSLRARLGAEHVIPESLGGKLLLNEASCENCERLINRFETFCAKHVFENLRYALGVTGKKGSVRRSKRRMTDTVAFWRQGKGELAEISIKSMPQRIVVPLPQVPGVMHPHRSRASAVLRYALYEFYSKDGLQEFCKLHNAEDVVIRSNGVKIEPFMRLIAKIAHSYAVARLGLGGFDPLLKDFILGNNQFDASYLIGASRIQWSSPDRHYIHLGLEKHRNHRFWVCRVQLFADFGLPEYIVFVGQIKGGKKIAPVSMRSETRWGLPKNDISTNLSKWPTNPLFVHPHDSEDSLIHLTFGTEGHADELDILLNTTGKS